MLKQTVATVVALVHGSLSSALGSDSDSNTYSAGHLQHQNTSGMALRRAWIRYDEVRQSQHWAFTCIFEKR